MGHVPHFTPRQLAQLIGSSESTLKRWIDAGRIRAERSVGKHRRVPLPEVYAFLRTNPVIVREPSLIGLSPTTVRLLSVEPSDPARELYEALVREEPRGVERWLARQREAGHDVETLREGPIADVLFAITELWKHDPDAALVHRAATERVARALAP
jgi:excisionase family DNA binding protein